MDHLIAFTTGLAAFGVLVLMGVPCVGAMFAAGGVYAGLLWMWSE